MAHHGQPLPVLTDVQREAQQREAAEQEQAKHNKQEDKWNYAKPHELDARDPSLKDGLDAVKLKQWRRQTMKLLSTAGMNLKIPQWGIAAAALLCQRFFSRRSMKKNDKYQIAMACLHLAAKMEESPKPIREVVKECQRVVLGRQTQKLKKALEPDAIDTCKDEVLVAERAVLYTLGFDLHVEHPYKFLVQHLSELGLLHANTQDTPFKHFMQNTWNFLNDSFRSNLCLQYPPYTIAMGALWCANQINVRIHGPSGDIMVAVKEKKGVDTTFFKYFKISVEQATDMANQILEMYEEIKRNPVKASNTPSLPGTNSQLLSPIG